MAAADESNAQEPQAVTRKPRFRARWTTARLALVLFLFLVAVYQANGTVVDEGDPLPNINLPVALLEHGTFSFSSEAFPEMFKWKSTPPLFETDEFAVRRWHRVFDGKTARQWKDEGHLRLNEPRYHLVESPTRHVFVNTFGPVPGLTFVPLVAALRLIDKAYNDNPLLALTAGKLHGSLLVAGSAVLLFLGALRYLGRWRALAIGALFALATCAWSIQSQNIWQQTVSTFFICLGACLFLRRPDSPPQQALAGLALGVAVACRPTSVLVLLALLVYLALDQRRACVYMACAAALAPAAVGIYNWYYFGSPLSFGQELVGHVMAQEKTGSPDLWQTRFYKGALGLLVSPSRGLLVFSPVLGFAALGARTIWLDGAYRALRPLSVAAFSIMALQCKWFDWWGGWTYGYRPWLDAVPLLVLCLIPVLHELGKNRIYTLIFSVTVAWSCFVQFLGAFAYDKLWNERTVYVLRLPHVRKPLTRLTQLEAEELARSKGGTYLGSVACNIDLIQCRDRLWSAEDSILLYYINNFSQARKHRYDSVWKDLGKGYKK